MRWITVLGVSGLSLFQPGGPAHVRPWLSAQVLSDSSRAAIVEQLVAMHLASRDAALGRTEVQQGTPMVRIALKDITPIAQSSEVALLQASLWGHTTGRGFIVGFIGSESFALGGFDGVDLREFDKRLDHLEISRGRLNLLVRAADPFGSEDMVIPAWDIERMSTRMRVEWDSLARLGFRADHQVKRAGGLVLHQVLAYSRLSDVCPRWIPVSYGFVFAQSGRLAGWSRTTLESNSFVESCSDSGSTRELR